MFAAVELGFQHAELAAGLSGDGGVFLGSADKVGEDVAHIGNR